VYPEIERFIIDLQQEMTKDDSGFGDELRELFSDIYASGAGDPDLTAMYDDMRWIAAQRAYAAAARFRAMAARFDRWHGEAMRMLEERGL
jgi:hypothetical protein